MRAGFADGLLFDIECARVTLDCRSSFNAYKISRRKLSSKDCDQLLVQHDLSNDRNVSFSHIVQSVLE